MSWHNFHRDTTSTMSPVWCGVLEVSIGAHFFFSFFFFTFLRIVRCIFAHSSVWTHFLLLHTCKIWSAKYTGTRPNIFIHSCKMLRPNEIFIYIVINMYYLLHNIYFFIFHQWSRVVILSRVWFVGSHYWPCYVINMYISQIFFSDIPA